MYQSATEVTKKLITGQTQQLHKELQCVEEMLCAGQLAQMKRMEIVTIMTDLDDSFCIKGHYFQVRML